MQKYQEINCLNSRTEPILSKDGFLVRNSQFNEEKPEGWGV
jgi:hypothetical protein